MRIAFYGGSFNPPHYSHYLAASWALCTGEVDQVWMIPTFTHAFGKFLAPFEHRVAMCRIGAELLSPKILVSTLESELPSPSYTIDTLRVLQHRHPSFSFRLLIGADILQETHAWKDFSLLQEIAPPLVIGRIGITAPSLPFSLPPFSSSFIREGIAKGTDISGHLPPPVFSYLREHRLYPSSS